MHSLDKIDENIAKIATLFPNCVTEAKDENGEITHKIDFDMLKQELSNSLVEGREERYQFTWPDKKQAILTANAPINKTLRPCREESVDFDNTENLYIEGDNLEVLKLLQETYLGKIKMIYIDPPYNTGNDFVYKDDFAESTDEYLANSGQFDEDGNRLVQNTESNGRFHTDWLNMIYPRLKLAKDLLTEDGAIFISIGDEELFNLQKITNEIFGASNFVANLIWQSTPGSNTGDDVKSVTENILLYCKDRGACKFATQEITDKDKYSNKDEYYEKRGGYVLNKLDRRMTGQHYSEALNYSIKVPNGTEIYPGGAIEKQEHWNWRWSKAKVEWGIKNGFIVMKNTNNGWAIYFKQYEKVNNDDMPIVRTLSYQNLINIDGANSARGTREVMELFDGKFFDYPKPLNLIVHVLNMLLKSGDIILDFFSGSATTAQAVMQLNAEERQRLELSMENLDKNDPNYESKFQNLKSQLSHQRKFIMVQLPEKTDEKSEAYKAGYKNICEIGKERIRRAGKKILEFRIENLDFKIKSLEKEGVIVKYARELSEIRSLEEIYGCCGECLSSGEKTSERRDLRTVGSNASSSCVDSVEHSGRSVAGNKGIYPIFENSKGISFGTRDTVIDLRTLELLNQRGYKINFDYFGRNQQNDLFTDKYSDRQTLSSKLQALSSQLSVLSSLPDIGFRVLKCDTSNMNDVYYSPDDLSKQDLFKDNIKTDRTPEDLLFQVMLDLGIELSSKIETKKIDGKTVYYVSENYLVACFDNDVTEETITQIAQEKPYYFVMRDSSMANDSVATNFEQIFKTYLGENYNPDNIKII